ncbi:DNA excision repair protein ERCC-6-like [Lamellibrachia satsuma]|nr:DNA excision repair protein ERCC-6-like [Lamellibrachia satsuma]
MLPSIRVPYVSSLQICSLSIVTTTFDVDTIRDFSDEFPGSVHVKGTIAGSEAGGGAKARFNTLVVKAKQLARDGYVSKALDLNKKALKLFNNEKLIRRIKKMEVSTVVYFLEAFLQDYNEESDGISEGEEADHSMVNVGNGFFLYKGLHDKLYDYQREGVLWMWGLYKKHKGGILGDDMGLGKTIQVIAFLSGMFDAEKIKCVMIVLPVAVMLNWDREFQKWLYTHRYCKYYYPTADDTGQ